MTGKLNQDTEIRLQGLDALTAIQWAGEGKVEAWVHRYLLSGSGGRTNPAFSEGLKREQRWWNGPIFVNLTDLAPAVGTDPGLEYVVDEQYWQDRTGSLAKSFSNPDALPPIIAEYRSGELSIRDGNTRFGAMKLLGWTKCWAIIWYNAESDFHQHNKILADQKTAGES